MRTIIVIAAFLFSSSLYAATCGNGNMLYKGYSTEQVLQKCGAPAAKNTSSKPTVQEWEYYISTFGNQNKTKLSLLIKNNQVSNINVTTNNATCSTTPMAATGTQTVCNANNQNLASTNVCGLMINVGDSAAVVINACSKPMFVRDSQNPNDMVTTTELDYPANHLVLLFENNYLTDIITR